MPMEGFGTDCYITFNRTGSEQLCPIGRAEAGGGGQTTGLLDVQERRLVGEV